jgi:hypothetical protein
LGVKSSFFYNVVRTFVQPGKARLFLLAAQRFENQKLNAKNFQKHLPRIEKRPLLCFCKFLPLLNL